MGQLADADAVALDAQDVEGLAPRGAQSRRPAAVQRGEQPPAGQDPSELVPGVRELPRLGVQPPRHACNIQILRLAGTARRGWGPETREPGSKTEPGSVARRDAGSRSGEPGSKTEPGSVARRDAGPRSG